MAELFGAVPVWLWLVVAGVAGGLLVVATPYAVEWFWEVVYLIQRFCLAVGVLVIAGLAGWVLLLWVGVVAPPRF